MKQFNSKSCEEIMTTVYKPIEFVIDGLLAQGLYILAGAPKVGKSWLVLDMCLSIAKGEKILGLKTSQGTALYLCLEDSYARIQNRLYELTDEPTEMLYFSVMSDPIGGGLEEQIEGFVSEHRDLKIVFIDTLQMVRGSTDSSYGSDYKDLSVLKALADKLEITVIVVHHTRKCKDIDPFNMISGSTGISGCVDGSMVLIETKRGSRNAKLYCVGRDIENQEINLVFENSRWKVVDEVTAKEADFFSFAVHDFMLERNYFKGSATELAIMLSKILCKEIFANHIKKELMKHAYELQSYGVTFKSRRSNGKRVIILKYDKSSDTGDGKNLMPEAVKYTDPAVTEMSSEGSEKPLNTLFEGDYGNQKDKNSADPVCKATVPVCNSTDPVQGEKICEVRWTTLDEILNESARKIRSTLASQGIEVPPF
ncbi:AAA family ATPase [Ruminococcus sp. 210702-SL.1.03]|uniref:AAA family ATPase n=1 Tax=Ruminococcus sp. 210702-SL.1.03 TaxID=2883233 RepID=UPI001D05EF98|nr:AAA family ATPase [Ruminococcus sp. 210702-SL.1.03]MCB6616648.1 helicase RepA family protein [Ruminococcus sp. 210702-SL.1.03]